MVSACLGPVSGNWGQREGTVSMLGLREEAYQKMQWHTAIRISQPFPHKSARPQGGDRVGVITPIIHHSLNSSGLGLGKLQSMGPIG